MLPALIPLIISAIQSQNKQSQGGIDQLVQNMRTNQVQVPQRPAFAGNQGGFRGPMLSSQYRGTQR